MSWSAGRTAHRQGDYRRAIALIESTGLYRTWQLFAWASTHLADVAHEQGNDERAMALLEESLTLFRDIGHQYGPALTLSVLGTVAHEQGDDERATALYEESLGLWTAIGFKWGMATTLHRLGTVAQAQGDDGRATALLEESRTAERSGEARPAGRPVVWREWR
jgi:tetratricopeptide (TPR) repeat protein